MASGLTEQAETALSEALEELGIAGTCLSRFLDRLYKMHDPEMSAEIQALSKLITRLNREVKDVKELHDDLQHYRRHPPG